MTKTIHNIVIYHFPCPDGEMSAAIFKNLLITESNTKFIPWYHENKEENMEKVKKFIRPFLESINKPVPLVNAP